MQRSGAAAHALHSCITKVLPNAPQADLKTACTMLAYNVVLTCLAASQDIHQSRFAGTRDALQTGPALPTHHDGKSCSWHVR